MNLATRTHLTTLRDLLTYRLQELRSEIHAAEQDHREPTIGSQHEVVDRKDEAARLGRRTSRTAPSWIHGGYAAFIECFLAMQPIDATFSGGA